MRSSLGRLRRRLGGAPPAPAAPEAQPLPVHGYDAMLRSAGGATLAQVEAACAAGGPEAFAHFRALEDDLWGLLLTREYRDLPNILAVLPDVPDRALQRVWNGTDGVVLAAQSTAFYTKARDAFDRHGPVPLATARVLDFGCGWGRLTRYFARDVEPGALFGCDPVESILDVCRAARVPADVRRSDFVPRRLPFDEPLHLAYAFSVFTHLSEESAQACLEALHAALAPGGVLVVTVRPPEYLAQQPLMRPALDELGADAAARLEEPRYVFVPHATEETHLQYDEGEMTYGEAIIPLAYIHERWSPLFDVVDVSLALADLHQVMVTLRRR